MTLPSLPNNLREHSCVYSTLASEKYQWKNLPKRVKPVSYAKRSFNDLKVGVRSFFKDITQRTCTKINFSLFRRSKQKPRSAN